MKSCIIIICICCLLIGFCTVSHAVVKEVCGIDVRSTQFGPFDHMKDFRLEFSDGSTETITMASNDIRQSFRFTPRKTSYVKIYLLSTYGDGGGGINTNSSGFSEVALYEILTKGKNRGKERLIKIPVNCITSSPDSISDTNWMVRNIADGNWGTPPYYPNQQWMARNIGVPGKTVWCRIDFEPAVTYLAVPVSVKPVNTTESRLNDPDGEWGVSKIVDGVWSTSTLPATQWKVEEIGRKDEDHWCKLSFGAEKTIFEIELQNSRFPGASRIEDIKLEFSNGDVLDHRLSDTDDRQTVSFKPVKSRWLKIHLLNCYGSDSASGGFGEVAVYEPMQTPTPGIYDLNKDGVSDLLMFYWNDNLTAFIADSGLLPWTSDLNRDWNKYFNKVFNVGSSPQVTWNRERVDWGSYTMLSDCNANGRFDDISIDYWYQVLDVDGDGDPDIERADRAHPELGLQIQKYFYDLDDDNMMNNIDWSGPRYGDEQLYKGMSNYLQDTSGNGFFTLNFEKWQNTYFPDLRAAWENPIAFYDLDDDGFTEQVVRATDEHGEAGGKLLEMECAFDIDNSGNKTSPSSLDIQLTWLGFQNKPFNYSKYVEDFPAFRGLPEADFFFGRRLFVRHATKRMWMPYFDAYKIGTELDKYRWNSAFLLVDEDNDDVRWEEMFSPHEFTGPDLAYDKHFGYDDHLGDRWESDDNYDGGGLLYIGKFDGRMHLYKADRAEWTIDYKALFKGSLDRAQESPAPPDGLQYSLVKYSDTDNNGFIDKIVYGERTVGDVKSFKVIREVNLLDYATPDNPHPDVCALFDIKTSDKLSNRDVAGWDGKRTQKLRNEAYIRLKGLFARTAESRWEDALYLYNTVKDAGLLKERNPSAMPEAAMKVSRDDHKAVLGLSDIRVTPDWQSPLSPSTEWDTYSSAYFLAESVFSEIIANAPEDSIRELSRLYYAGELRTLAEKVKSFVVR
ncbi:MAG: discoidin domain-containing protein [Armatimonadota bacterium]